MWFRVLLRFNPLGRHGSETVPQPHFDIFNGFAKDRRVGIVVEGQSMTDKESRHNYSIHEAITIGIEPQDNPVASVIDRTFQHFSAEVTTPDLLIHLGRFPSPDWKPTGLSVGDRMFYDKDIRQTVVFHRQAGFPPSRDDVDYIVVGDVRGSDEGVEVYVPKTNSALGYWKRVGRQIARRKIRSAALSLLGSSMNSLEEVELQAARIRLGVIEPFLYYRLPRKGYSLVHASVVSQDGSGLMFAGSGHVGKTTLALQMVKGGMSYFGDDLVIINQEGMILSYPEPLQIEGQHLAMFPELSRVLTKRLGFFEKRELRKTGKQSTKEMVESMPRLAITEIFGDAEIGERCPLRTVILLRRGFTPRPTKDEMDSESLKEVLSAELFWEFETAPWRHTQYLYAGSCALGVDYLEEEQRHHGDVKKIFASALKDAHIFRVQLSQESSIDTVNSLVGEIIGPAVRGTPRVSGD